MSLLRAVEGENVVFSDAIYKNKVCVFSPSIGYDSTLVVIYRDKNNLVNKFR